MPCDYVIAILPIWDQLGYTVLERDREAIPTYAACASYMTDEVAWCMFEANTIEQWECCYSHVSPAWPPIERVYVTWEECQ